MIDKNKNKSTIIIYVETEHLAYTSNRREKLFMNRILHTSASLKSLKTTFPRTWREIDRKIDR